MHRRLLLALLPSPLLLGACTPGTDNFSTTQSLAPREQNIAGFATWSDATVPYRFEPGDKVKVQFLLTPEMGETALVGPDGAISLRVAGRVAAAGRESDELQAAITEAARRYLTNPIVTVGLEEAAGSVVFVGGQVRRAGAYPIGARRGVAEAVILAGGFEPDSRMDQVVLIRRSRDNRPMLRTVDVRGFINAGAIASDVPLMAGDIVFVPRTRVAEIALWVDQFITRTLPFNRAFSYTINRNLPGNLF